MEIKTLLILLRNNIELEAAFRCLCYSIFRMRCNCLITADEYYLLLDYIHDNRPLIFQKHFSYLTWITNSWYYWLPGNKKPRLRWLDDQIKKL